MKLAYVTNVKIPESDAQSIQVQSMCKVFFDRLNRDFLLISPRIKENKKLKTQYNWKRIFVFSKIPRSFRYLLLIKFAWFTIFKFKPDIIYSRDIGVVWFYKLLGYKTVYEIHKPFETKIGNWFFKHVAEKIKIITISQALKDYLVSDYELDEKNILVAHDGVNLLNFNFKKTKEEYRKELLNIDDNKKVVMYAGTSQPGKGVEIVIELAKKMPEYLFYIIGEKKDDIELSGNLNFIDRQENYKIPYYLKSADLLILPNTKQLKYYKYTSPLKLFEYMASGVSILSSNIGSITEILDETNSYLFNPEIVDEAVGRIKHIFSDFDEVDKKVKQALDNVKEYTWEKRAEKILNFIK